MSPKVKRFQDLLVWQCAHALFLRVHRASAKFPREEIFGLTAQVRRSASSVAANIVEGFGRGRKEFIQSLVVANGSLEETKYHLLAAKDLQYLPQPAYDDMVVEAERVGRLLHALTQALRAVSPPKK